MLIYGYAIPSILIGTLIYELVVPLKSMAELSNPWIFIVGSALLNLKIII